MRPKVGVPSRNTILVRAAVTSGKLLPVSVSRRRRSGPLQGAGVPGVVGRLRSFEHAVEQVEDEYELGNQHGDCGPCRNDAEILECGHCQFWEVVVVVNPAVLSSESVDEHWNEDQVERYDR